MTQDISTWTLTGLVRRQAELYGEREFMSFEHGTVLSFAALDRDSDQLACNLASLGVAPGDRCHADAKESHRIHADDVSRYETWCHFRACEYRAQRRFSDPPDP